MSDADPYSTVAGGKLKLKPDSSIKKKKKKSKDKDKEKVEKTISDGAIHLEVPTTSGRQMTQAEQKFKQMQDKMVRFECFDEKIRISFYFRKRNKSLRKHQ